MFFFKKALQKSWIEIPEAYIRSVTYSRVAFGAVGLGAVVIGGLLLFCGQAIERSYSNWVTSGQTSLIVSVCSRGLVITA